MRYLVKTLIIGLLIFSARSGQSQENKFSFSFEYAPNYSSISNKLITSDLKLSHLVRARVEYNFKPRFRPTVGVGFMNTGDVVKSNNLGQFEIDEAKFTDNYNFMIVPVGLRIKLGMFYIHPEIGPGFNVSKKTKQELTYTNGETEVKKVDLRIIGGDFNSITVPVFLTLGTEIEVGNLSLLIGAHGYYGINKVVADVPRSVHFYGIGLQLGVKI